MDQQLRADLRTGTPLAGRQIHGLVSDDWILWTVRRAYRRQAAGQARSRMMATAEQRNHAKSFLEKAEDSIASTEANLAAERYTPAAGDAIHAGMRAKDAIVTVLTGSTSKGNDRATAAKNYARRCPSDPRQPRQRRLGVSCSRPRATSSTARTW